MASPGSWGGSGVSRQQGKCWLYACDWSGMAKGAGQEWSRVLVLLPEAHDMVKISRLEALI